MRKAHRPPPSGAAWSTRERQPSRTAAAWRGFTLVEVLVALSIMAVIALMTWRAIGGMVRAQQATAEYTDSVLSLQAGLEQWRADLNAMVVWPATEEAAANSPRSLAWDGKVLRITRTLDGDPGGGVYVAAWTLRTEDGAWLRWQSAPVRSVAAWRAAWDAAGRWAETGTPGTGNSENARAVVVARALGWQIYYFLNNAWTNPLSSSAESSTRTRTLPDAVRFVMTLAPGQAINGSIALDWIRPTFGGPP